MVSEVVANRNRAQYDPWFSIQWYMAALFHGLPHNLCDREFVSIGLGLVYHQIESKTTGNRLTRVAIRWIDPF